MVLSLDAHQARKLAFYDFLHAHHKTSSIAPWAHGRLFPHNETKRMSIFSPHPLLVYFRHALPVAEVRGRLERAAQAAEQRHHVSWRWAHDVLEVLPPAGIARGARGRVLVRDDEVRVEVLVPLSFLPMRQKIQTRLSQALEDLLSTDCAA